MSCTPAGRPPDSPTGSWMAAQPVMFAAVVKPVTANSRSKKSSTLPVAFVSVPSGGAVVFSDWQSRTSKPAQSCAKRRPAACIALTASTCSQPGHLLPGPDHLPGHRLQLVLVRRAAEHLGGEAVRPEVVDRVDDGDRVTRRLPVAEARRADLDRVAEALQRPCGPLDDGAHAGVQLAVERRVEREHDPQPPRIGGRGGGEAGRRRQRAVGVADRGTGARVEQRRGVADGAASARAGTRARRATGRRARPARAPARASVRRRRSRPTASGSSPSRRPRRRGHDAGRHRDRRAAARSTGRALRGPTG